MKVVVLVVCCSILTPLLSAQVGIPKPGKRECKQDPQVLYEGVVHKMWSKDEGDVVTARGFIRIAISPHWNPESFVSVRLNKDESSNVTVYSLPTKTKYLVDLIRSELKKNPCATAERIASRLAVIREPVNPNKELQSVIDQFMSLRLEPRPFADFVRLDTTQYDVEFCGEDTVRIVTDDWEAPIAQWVQDVEAAIISQKQQDRQQ